jgi:Zn finger protein HypA/HybF involved in hydrogenase expression
MVTPLHRSLEQELFAVLRGASLECLVCGEFLLHEAAVIACPECGASLRNGDSAAAGLPREAQAG